MGDQHFSTLRESQVKSVQKVSGWLALPALGWYFWFLLIPLGIVTTYSFATRGAYGRVLFEWSIDNYVRSAEWVYLKVLWNSLCLAGTTALGCLLLGYPMAYLMGTASPRLRSFLLVLVVVPFWTNFVVRTYATKALFGSWCSSYGLVLIGMITNYLPFMVLPLYVSIEKFDFALMEAARDLGASPLRGLISVLLPLTRRGIITGLILVFTPALGEFVIPDLLGGARTLFVGNLITEQFLKSRDWPFGSALSLVLILMVLLSLVGYFFSRTHRVPEHPRRGSREDHQGLGVHFL